jgi:nicotinamide-nucleotide amidase
MSAAESLESLAGRLGAALALRGWRVVTAESCTGGGIAETITRIAGSSQWFDQGFVPYTDAAKQAQLDVPVETLETHGAVSAAVVEALVTGALTHGNGDLAVAVSGIAGPGGGMPAKPVGTVWLACARRGAPPEAQCFQFDGDRAAVRDATIRVALEALIAQADGGEHP